MNEIESKVKQAIRKVVKITEEEIQIDSQLVNIGIDSFAGIELVFALEDMFNIDISDEEMAQMKTVRDIINGIRIKTKK